jgi:hypothetical protein
LLFGVAIASAIAFVFVVIPSRAREARRVRDLLLFSLSQTPACQSFADAIVSLHSQHVTEAAPWERQSPDWRVCAPVTQKQ